MATTITRISDSDSLAGTATRIALDHYSTSDTLTRKQQVSRRS